MGEKVSNTQQTKRQNMPGLVFEKNLWDAGFNFIGGLDEAGRGAWAGPVYAAIVVLPKDKEIKKQLGGVRDSKKMTACQREKWAEVIKLITDFWGIGFADHNEIDEYGIVPATKLAMQRAIGKLKRIPDYLLIDAVKLSETLIPQSILIKGDSRSLSIASASVLAKTERDRIMVEYDSIYPEFGFYRHKGYGTFLHRQRLEKNGPLDIHRKTYAPIKRLLGN